MTTPPAIDPVTAATDALEKPAADAQPKGRRDTASRKRKEQDKENEQDQQWKLPAGYVLTEAKERLIRRYKCFEFENQVYAVKDSGWCVPVSTFICKIHMHINDEVPTRLISVVNVDHEEEVMHVPHDIFNGLMTFRKAVTGRGNFQWKGSEGDYNHYLWFMMDYMGKGRMILEPGQQPEGFFVFTNAALHKGRVIPFDKFGCFDVDGTRYYVPAGNIIPGMNNTGYSNARKVIHIESDVTFEALNRQMRLVHREHSMLASVHALASVFSDHIRERLQCFPVPFYYGPPGTGKDQLIKSNQNLFGRPQAPLRLPALNTGVAQVNLFAELRGIPLYLTEWASNLKPEVHAFIMGIWDGEGRRRGEKIMAGRSRYSTEDVPIWCTASVAGNEYPNIIAQLLDRLIVEETPKLSGITMDMRTNYRDLAKMNEKGYSYLLNSVVKHREAFVRDWYAVHYNEAQSKVNNALGDNYISERMRNNLSIIIGVHHFFQDKLAWAFTNDELTGYLVKGMIKQQSQQLSGDEVSNFWVCFISAVNDGMLKLDKHFALDEELGVVAFYWNEVLPCYLDQHNRIYRLPGKRDILSKLKQHNCFVPGPDGGVHTGYRIGIGDAVRKSSAYVFDIKHTGIDMIGLFKPELQSGQFPVKPF